MFLKIDLEVIKKFGIVGCSPPIAPEDLDPKIKELEQRLVSLSKEGEQELAQIKKSSLKTSTRRLRKTSRENRRPWSTNLRTKSLMVDTSARSSASRSRRVSSKALTRKAWMTIPTLPTVSQLVEV